MVDPMSRHSVVLDLFGFLSDLRDISRRACERTQELENAQAGRGTSWGVVFHRLSSGRAPVDLGADCTFSAGAPGCAEATGYRTASGLCLSCKGWDVI
jgi:hypothetical protein